MVQARTAKGITLPAPIGGVDFQSPLAQMEPTSSPFMQNAYADNRKCKTRGGMKAHTTGAYNAHTLEILGFLNGKIYAYDSTALTVHDVTAGGALDAGTDISTWTSGTAFTSNFAKALYFFSLNTDGVLPGAFLVSGGSWATINYTYAGSDFTPIGATSFKGRHYIISSANQSFAYSGIGELTGSVTTVDLSSIFTEGQKMSWIATFTTQDGITNDIYLAFGNNTGEVLVYSGDYPGSSTWSLRARFRISPTISNRYTHVVSYQSDALIITITGLVSLRDLLTKGNDAALNHTVSRAIDPLWLQLMNMGSTKWCGAFFPDKKQIVIAAQYYINKDGSTDSTAWTYFVLNTLTGAWSVYKHVVGNATYNYPNYMLYANNALYIVGLADTVGAAGVSAVIKYEGDTTTNKDINLSTNTTVAFGFEIDSAWNSFGTDANVKKVNAFEALVKTALNGTAGQLKCAASADFGVSTSADCEVDVAAAQVGYQKIVYSIGVSGTYFQYQIKGTSGNGADLELYGVNAIVELGGLLS